VEGLEPQAKAPMAWDRDKSFLGKSTNWNRPPTTDPTDWRVTLESKGHRAKHYKQGEVVYGIKPTPLKI